MNPSPIAPRHLRVAANHRTLETSDGRPFFYLADTAWELFHRLTLAQADHYLSNRAAKGFTVIQAVVLAELDGLTDPNPNGDLPLFEQDPTRPNEAYFRHVDAIVQRAAQLGLVIGLLPTWGRYWKHSGFNVQSIFTPESAHHFGRFLGERYRNSPLIWILGGDYNVETADERAIIDALAAGLAAGDGGAHLKTFHPRGPGRSSTLLHEADWLDFNMAQSSHAAHDHDNGLLIEADYGLAPTKPTLDGEPRYERVPAGFYLQGVSRLDRFDDYDVRQAAYWSLLAGACGFTYGNNNVWKMWAPERKPVLWADIPWDQAIDHPGAFQMGVVRRLFAARPFHKLIPDPTLVVDGPRSGGAKIRAARAEDGSFALIYSPRGEPFTLNQQRIQLNQQGIQALRINQIWYDPRYGSSYLLHVADSAAIQTYTPPTQGRGQDWVLILEDQAAGLLLP